jgi:hypothetical protein
MRSLPKNIYANTGGGYVVRIKRSGVKLIYCTASLARALEKRDEFLTLHGRIAIAAPRSNTGITGISEVTKWRHNRAYDCFQVTTASPRQPGAMKRFGFRTLAEREQALQSAINHRARGLGISAQEVTHAC